jgi:hypothetical protein
MSSPRHQDNVHHRATETRRKAKTGAHGGGREHGDGSSGVGVSVARSSRRAQRGAMQFEDAGMSSARHQDNVHHRATEARRKAKTGAHGGGREHGDGSSGAMGVSVGWGSGRAQRGAMGGNTSPCPPPPPCARALPLTLFFSVSPCLCGEYDFDTSPCPRALPLTLFFSVSPCLCGEYGFDTSLCPPPPPCARALPLTLLFSVSPSLCGEYGFAYANAPCLCVEMVIS